MQKDNGYTLAEVLITLGVIGVVVALIMPTLVQNYQKQVTITRLKKTYSILYQAVQMSMKDNGDIESWDFSLSTQDFVDKYIVSYINEIKTTDNNYKDSRFSKKYILADGVSVVAWSWVNPLVKPFVQLEVDINGSNPPNSFGYDIFYYHIFSQKSVFYNGGQGDVAKNVDKGGLYPDGYGVSRPELLNNKWRGCNRKKTKVLNESDGVEQLNAGGAYCTALIMYDGWQIKQDYKWNKK